MYLAEGRFGEAWRRLEARAADIHVLDPLELLQLAEASQHIGDRAVHASVVQQLAERAPSLEPWARAHAYAVIGKTALREGRPIEARGAYEAGVEASRAAGDPRQTAVALGLLADLHQAQGRLDEALRIRREEVLPVYEALGDVRSKAATMGQIADVLQARGQLDEALRIRREEELPVYEALGDVRSKAVIADVFQARGQLDEALRIFQEELLPAFEALGDVRSKAVTMGKIADVFQARGQLDEALRIFQEELLPAFEALGDVRSKAVTMGRIADVYQARGQLDEALRIRREEQLPAFEALGDVHSLLVTWTNIALLLMSRGRSDDAATVISLLFRAYQAAHAHGYAPERTQIAEIIRGIGLPSPEDDPDAFAELARRLESAASSSANSKAPEDP